MVKTFSGPVSQQQNPNRVEPTGQPRLDLLERDEVKAKRPSMWNIVFYNDDYTSMDFVVFVLTNFKSANPHAKERNILKASFSQLSSKR